MKELLYLTIEELKSIREANFNSERLDKVRDIFIFCCLTGLNYGDLKRLSRDNLYEKGEILFIRINHVKTKQEMSIPLDGIAIDILHKYKGGDSLLPLISHQKLNVYLKELAEKCNIIKTLTLMTAHTTFAILMLSCGYPRHVVSKMLGHKQSKSLSKYLNILNHNVF